MNLFWYTMNVLVLESPGRGTLHNVEVIAATCNEAQAKALETFDRPAQISGWYINGTAGDFYRQVGITPKEASGDA